ncbi:PAS domain S-box protein [Halarchaeum sp. P4]|uniref:PAS domain-containing protein n=1 Tax=Halarchaeum sp. P4 TaxID=3421639 RepID=UPI003EBEE63F
MTAPVASQQAGIQVLYVDDDGERADRLAATLTQANGRFDVTTAASAETGLDRLAAEAVDCVVADYDLPESDGLEFLRAVRATHPDLPFVLYTADGSEDVASAAITAGVDEYLQRDADETDVLAERLVSLVETERAESTRSDIQRLFSEVADRTNDVLWLFTEGWEDVVFINDAYEDVFGQSRDALDEDPVAFLDVIPEPDRERLAETMSDLTAGESMDIEVRVEDGSTTREVWIKGEPITDHTGTVTHVGGFTRDVTERKRRERELASAERQYRAMFEDPNILVGVLAPDGTVRDINPTAMEYIEGDVTDVVGEPFPETPWWGDDDALQTDVEEWVSRAADGEYVEFEADIEGADGTRTVSGVFRPVRDDDGDVVSIIVSDRDITERKEREQELERYEAYLERSTDVITVIDVDGTMQYQSPSVARTLGYERGALLGQNTLDLVHPDDVDDVRDTLQTLVENPEAAVTVEARFETADGEWRWLEVRGRNYLDHPDIEGIVTNSRDITERKRNEAELVRMRDLLERTERIADVGGWEVDAETLDIFWSEHLFDLLGVDYEEEPPLDEALDAYHEADRPVVEDAINTALTDGEPFDIEVRFHRSDHETGWLRVQGVPVHEDGEVTVLRGAAQDITERKRDERELARQNERLEEFASVVSHDLKNPLSVASGYLDLARENHDSDALAEVACAHDRMRDLIEDLLTLARTGERVQSTDALNLARVAQDAWRHVPTASAELVVVSNATVRADENVLQQLFENLFRNAVEHGGEDVTITVAARECGFIVADDGAGFPDDHHDQLFEAGYTTEASGTGFGLAIVEQCADAHGWTIDTADSVDGGAQFELSGVTVEDVLDG